MRELDLLQLPHHRLYNGPIAVTDAGQQGAGAPVDIGSSLLIENVDSLPTGGDLEIRPEVSWDQMPKFLQEDHSFMKRCW
jgi:hypothetical protein